MAINTIKLTSPISLELNGGEALNALVTETVKQNEMMEDHKQYKNLLGYTDTPLLNPDQKFSSRTPNGGLKNITETGLKNERNFTLGAKKGIVQREIGDFFSMSYLMTQWAKKGQNLSGAPEGIQAEAIETAEQTKDLIQGYDIAYAEELVGTPAKGFSVVVVNGETNACARDGKALFDATHELKDGSTFSNLITGAVDFTDIASGQAKLQKGLDMLKTMKFDNGKKVKQVKGEAYKLYCSRVKETYWLEVINNGSDNAGTGNNSAKENTFNFRNNLVEVVVLDLLGDVDSNGAVIGSDEMFFITNPEYIKKAKAFRCANLYSPRIKMYENDETDVMTTSIRAIVGAGHYDAEFGCVGSTGI